eukprot:4912461-Amphidinium_carterae.1
MGSAHSGPCVTVPARLAALAAGCPVALCKVVHLLYVWLARELHKSRMLEACPYGDYSPAMHAPAKALVAVRPNRRWQCRLHVSDSSELPARALTAELALATRAAEDTRGPPSNKVPLRFVRLTWALALAWCRRAPIDYRL